MKLILMRPRMVAGQLHGPGDCVSVDAVQAAELMRWGDAQADPAELKRLVERPKKHRRWCRAPARQDLGPLS